jgi:hypothetical protein
MKPKSQISRPTSRTDRQGSFRPDSRYPLIDYSFHPAQRPANRARSNHRPSQKVFAPGFRDLSNKFLGAETTRNYVVEFLFFAVITSVSAWPIVSMAQALAQWMK